MFCVATEVAGSVQTVVAQRSQHRAFLPSVVSTAKPASNHAKATARGRRPGIFGEWDGIPAALHALTVSSTSVLTLTFRYSLLSRAER